MGSLLKFILIVFALYYVLKFFLKLLLGNMIVKAYKQQQDFQTSQKNKYDEKKIHVKNTSKKSTQIKGGDYIDFEEIK